MNQGKAGDLMHQSQRDLGDYSLFIGWASAVGIFLVAVVAIAGNASDPLRGLLIFFGFGLPFLVAIASVIIPFNATYRRWTWLVCALGALIPSYFFIWNGMGFFLFAIVLTYLWAFWSTRRRIEQRF
ncbi:MAG: hypothetical protein ACR2OE_08720 [Thermomicrobiales bacterium]